MLFGGAGSRFSFGVFLRPVTEEFEWSRASMAGALATAGLATGALRPVAGMLADRYDPKQVVAIGVLIGGLSMAGMSFIQELWHLYALFIFMGIGFTLASAAATAKIVGAWFTRRRALAMSIAGTGSAAGETALIGQAIACTAFGVELPHLITIEHDLVAPGNRVDRTFARALAAVGTEILQTEINRLVGYQRDIRCHDH